MSYWQRTPNSKEVMLNLNTNQATLNNSLDWSFPLIDNIKGAKSIRLSWYNIPWSWYNCDSSNYNIVFRETGDVVDISFNLPIGQYNPNIDTNFKDNIQAGFNYAGNQIYTVSLSLLNYALTIVGATRGFTIYTTSPSGAITTASELMGLQSTISSVGGGINLSTIYLLPNKEIQIRMPTLINNYEGGNTLNVNTDLIMSASLSGYNYGQYLTNINSSYH